MLKVSAAGVAVTMAAYVICNIGGAMSAPSYNACAQLISELGVGNSGWALALRATLVLAGAALMIHAIAWWTHAERLLARLLLALGVSLLLGGIFPCDTRCEPITFSGTMHLVSGIPGVLASLIGPFHTWRRLKVRKAIAWRSALANTSLLIGVCNVTFVLIIATASITDQLSNVGIWQRLATATTVAWTLLTLIEAIRPDIIPQTLTAAKSHT